MKLTDFIRKLITNYFIIFASIVILLTLMRQIFLPGSYFTVKDMYIYMVCALAADLSSILLYSPVKISEKEMRVRIILHFIALEATLLILANAMGWIGGLSQTIALAVQIAVIYVLLRAVLWTNDRKSADRINEKLKAVKDELDE